MWAEERAMCQARTEQGVYEVVSMGKRTNELLSFILDFLEFCEMSFNCFSMVLKYFMYVALKVNDITRCAMKNSSPLSTLLHLELKHFQLLFSLLSCC